MAEVVQNLLNNAIKFTDSVTIAVHSEIMKDGTNRNQIIVQLKNGGTGIDPETLPYVFTKFVTKSDRGTGLGLYISRRIIEAHGGQICGKHDEDGKGATFSFSLPLEGQIEQAKENKMQNNGELQAQ